MARQMYGATSADFTLTAGGRVVPGATLTVWTARTGGTQVTDLLDRDSVATTTVTSGGDGSVVFYGPDETRDTLWLSSGQGSRVAVRPVSILGTPAELAIGTVTTGTAAVTISGDETAGYELDFVLPSAGANGVDTAAIQAKAVTAAKIADDTITATQIAANAVGASELADNAVNVAALDADDLGNGLVLTADSGEPSGMKWSAYGIADLDIGTVDTGTPAAASMTGNPQDGYELNLTLPPFSPDALPTVDPVDFGAVGDGVTDDLAAFVAALATGKSLWLTNGTTYVVSSRLTLAADQNIYGNGATIKRADQVSTTTTTTITSGATSAITVASVAGLKVGQYINVEQGGQAATTEANSGVTFDQTPRRITDITGNVVTISGTFAVSLSGTTNVHTSGILLSAASGHSTVRDLTVDGNRDNHTWAYWSAVIDVYVGSYAHVDHVHVVDSAAEAFVIGGTYPRVTNCSVVDCDGNAYHLSGATHPVIDKCSAVGSNLAGSPGTGHADGCITWSDAIVDGTISDCYLSGGLLAGIGGIGQGNYDITITGCTIRDMTQRAIYIYQGADDAGTPARIVMTGNRIYDSVIVEIGTSNTKRVKDFVFSGNYVEDTKVRFGGTQGGVVDGNVFVTADANTRTQLETRDADSLTISNNMFRAAGAYAIDLGTYTPGSTYSYGCKVVGNTISGSVTEHTMLVTATTWVIQGNVIHAPGGSARVKYCILVSRGSGIIADNRIDCAAGIMGAAIYIETTASPGIIIKGNHVSGAGYNAISLPVSDGVIADNVVMDSGQKQAGNAGIFVSGSRTSVTGNRCFDTADDPGSKKQYYGIRVYGGSTDGVKLSGNMVEGNAVDGILLSNSPTNVGQTPNRKVSATVNSTQTTIAHGLDYIPIAVQVSMTSAGTVWQSAAADGTNVYLTADADSRTCDIWVG